ncbi:SAM-dependent methyltransferase [Wenzhouxiangella sp. C33]|uniref:SAM-dependent methyltransferase n=2 Tax=Wenzhouxiangella limi TaxID=2707351 RepID=A0A845UUT2_9GAMM|nr:SAM-dependent methyltransferase [Wenzhouxiangella limi]
MAMALYEPGLGYYVNGLLKFGQAGDFVTAPEQGSLFSIALAGQIDQLAAALDAPYTIMEPGAGSGALARDLLNALERTPQRYLILEPSAALRQIQRETLADLPADLARRVEWLAAPPEQPFSGVIVANEVADALPVSLFEVTAQGLRERCVQVGNTRLEWALERPQPRLQRAFEQLEKDLGYGLPEGYVSEICLDLPGWLQTVSQPLAQGALLLFDYGYPRSEYYLPERAGGTLVCHYRHRAHFDPFVWPGLTDLSAFVDFSALAAGGVGCGLEVAGFTTQADFLLAMGTHEAVEREKDERERLRLAGELKRLILPGEMGEKFKLLALTRNPSCPLSGLEEANQLNRL